MLNDMYNCYNNFSLDNGGFRVVLHNMKVEFDTSSNLNFLMQYFFCYKRDIVVVQPTIHELGC